MANKKYEIHPMAEVFSEMTPEDYKALKSDIVKRELIQEPVELYEGKIVDGRHRYRVSEETKIPCAFVDLHLDEGTTLFAYLWSKNMIRRHMTQSQKSMTAARCAELSKGKNESLNEATVRLCEQVGVSVRLVMHARAVKLKGSQELIDAVEAGELPVAKASTLAKGQTKAQQIETISFGRPHINKTIRNLHAAIVPPKPAKSEPTGARAEVDNTFKNQTVKECIGAAKIIRKRILALKKNASAWLKLEQFDKLTNDLIDVLEYANPAKVCPVCKGEGKDCKPCRKSGWMPKAEYDDWKVKNVKPD